MSPPDSWHPLADDPEKSRFLLRRMRVRTLSNCHWLAALAISLSIGLAPRVSRGEASAHPVRTEFGSAAEREAKRGVLPEPDRNANVYGSRSQNTEEGNEQTVRPQLPDVRSLIGRPQLLKEGTKYKKCQTEILGLIDTDAMPPPIVDPNWSRLDAQAKHLGIFTSYMDTRRVFFHNRPSLRKKIFFSVAIYSLSKTMRRNIFIVDLSKSQIRSIHIQHGRGTFRNAGPHRSSLGCFVGGANIEDVAFTLHGIDGVLNSYACERRLQVHISQTWGARQPSFGCLTLQRGHTEAYRAVAAAVSGGGLICAYDEGRALDRR